MKNLKHDNTIVCIAGKNNVACDSLFFLADGNYVSTNNILVLPNSSEQDVSWMKSLRKTADGLGVTIADAIEDLYGIDNLVFFSLEYNRIIKPEKFSSHELFNIHFSRLPAYKGMYTSAWPILNGERTTAVTLHKIDHRIDGGEIVDQLDFAISATDTCRDLYFNYNMHGVELFKRNIAKILDGDYDTEPQSAYDSSYYSRESIDYKAIEIDFKRTAFEVHNQVRAFIFPEYQLPEVGGHKIVKSEITNSSSASQPGLIISDNETFITVATIDYDVRLYRKIP